MAMAAMELGASLSITKHNEKVGKALQKFLDPNFKVKNDVYLNQFLTHLVAKIDDDKILQKQANKPLKEQFGQWIIQASTLWDQKKVSPPAAILSFALNLASQLSIDEQIFVRLNCQNVFESLVGVVERNTINDPGKTLGMVTLLCSFLEHKSGVQWVVATTHWTDVINLGLTAHTMYIRKKAHQFVTKLLEKTISFNRNFGLNLVAILVKPLKDVFRSLSSNLNTQHTHIKNRELFESLKPTLDFISEVTEKLLNSFNKNALQLFMELDTPEVIEQIHVLSQIEDFSFDLLKVQFIFLFYKLCTKLDGVKVVAHDALTIYDVRIMFNLIQNEMNKNNVRCVIKICDYAHSLYYSLASRLPLCVRKGETIEFQNQMVLFQLMPILAFSIQGGCIDKRSTNILLTDDFRKDFIQKLLRMAAIKSIELCYKWKENLATKPNLVDDATFSLQYLVKTKKMLNKERAATMFPALVYSLRDSLTIMQEAPHTELTQRYKVFLSTLIETIIDLVESFHLTWKDSIETIRVMDLACDFLQYPNWTDKMIVIKGLKLLNTAICKYMSPDMVLLIYNTKDSKVSQTGSLLYTKCHDSSWKIRDSALEVVHTLSLNANTKFPAYTNILVEAELPQLVVNMALKDGEYYVRATAFKCLQELIQIPEIWNVLLKQDTFLENMLNIFENETEGIVRKEAAVLIHKIKKFQNFPEGMLPRLYDVMTHAAIGDLHWEVKYCALDFWFHSWEEHLIQQGMIDRMFPSYTFSQEHRKIVALNETEVRKRVIKVLKQLGQIGCLHVMKCAVQDDCDIEVSRKATNFAVRILPLFRSYKVSSENIDLSQPPSPTVLQNPPQQLIEPLTPASSTMSTMSSVSSPQLLTSQFLESPSPSRAPLSPSLELDVMTPPESLTSHTLTSRNTHFRPQHTQTSQVYVPHHQHITLQDKNTSIAQQDAPLNNTPANQIMPNINLTTGTCDIDVDMLDGGYADFGTAQLENIDSTKYDPVKTDKMLEDFLNSNDMTLLQEIYSPSDQVTNTTTQMKTKTYMAPSEYLKFVFNAVEAHALQKTQWLNSLDEFDSLLDDILNEYSIDEDVNSMDCY